MRRLLKPLRLAVAALVLVGLTAGFVEFRGSAPVHFFAHVLAHLQFTPSFIALTTGGALAAGFGLILIGTLLFGRVYCSTLCPLGLLQDVIARLADRLWPRRHRLAFKRGSRWVRYGVLAAVVAAILGGAGGIACTYADPYSNFGRIAAGLFRPLLVLANDALVPLAHALGWPWLYRVEPAWPAPAVLLSALLVLALVTGLVVWRRRIYCNTLCPVGTVLGLLSRFSLFRLTIDGETCTKCAACLRTCKAQCLDLRHGVIDASRCVMCFNCVDACPDHGIGYEFAWGRPPAADRPVSVPGSAAVVDPSRRALLAGATALALAPAYAAAGAHGRHRHRHGEEAARAPVTPPGSDSTARFLDRCTGCQLCVSACLTQVLRPAFLEYGLAGFMKPRLDFDRSFCNYDCRHCGEICPTGAITLLDLADKQVTSLGTAHFVQRHCIVDAEGTDCAACSEHCPTKAVDTVPFRDNLRLPKVNEELCIGCGACEYACPARPQKAITVVARTQHIHVKRHEEAKPADKPATTDFPF